MPAPGQSPYDELFKSLAVTPHVADGDYVKVEIIDGEPVFSIIIRNEMQRPALETLVRKLRRGVY